MLSLLRNWRLICPADWTATPANRLVLHFERITPRLSSLKKLAFEALRPDHFSAPSMCSTSVHHAYLSRMHSRVVRDCNGVEWWAGARRLAGPTLQIIHNRGARLLLLLITRHALSSLPIPDTRAQ